MEITDQNSDVSFKKIAEIYITSGNAELEEALSSVTVTREPLEKIASSLFADSDNRKFPVTDRDNVLLSSVYFNSQRDSFSSEYIQKVGSTLETFRNLYNIPEKVVTISISKTASENANPMVEILPSLGIVTRATPTDMKLAETIFDRDYKNLNVTERVEFAKNFVKIATDYGIPVTSKTVAKYASQLDTDFVSTTMFIEARGHAAARKGSDPGEFFKLASMLAEYDEKEKDQYREKIAEILQSLDEQHGFDSPKYDNSFPDAYATVFNKEAEMDNTEESSDDKLKKMTKSDIVGKYGDGVLEEVEGDDGEIDYEALAKIIRLSKGYKED